MPLTFMPGEDGDGHVSDTAENPQVPKEHMARKDAKYFTSEELTLIRPLRQGFRDIAGHDYSARAAYLRKNIFPPLLSYWYRDPSTKHRTEPANIDIWTEVSLSINYLSQS